MLPTRPRTPPRAGHAQGALLWATLGLAWLVLAGLILYATDPDLWRLWLAL